MKINLKQISIIFAVFFGLIICVQYMLGRAIDGIKPTTSITADQSTEHIKKADRKKPRIRKTTPMSAEQRYQQAKKNLDHEELKKKYGITITPRRHGPESAQEWQEYIETNIVNAKLLDSPEAQMILSTMQTSEEDYNQHLEYIEEEIKQTKVKLAEEPFNNKYKRQLEAMTKMQAMGEALKKNLVIQERAAAPETAPSITDL